MLQIYAIPEDCPPRIADSNKAGYSGFDNLFGSARSLDGELLISDGFSFEDIPDVIPLEDPLYDNLTDANNGANASEKDANEGVDASVRDANNSQDTQVGSEDFHAKNETGNSKEIIEDENEVVLREKETVDEKEVLNNKDNEIPNDSFKSVFGNEQGPVENEKLQDFHVIDSEKDLDVPSGVEGPVPVAVLPPQNFVVASPPQGW